MLQHFKLALRLFVARKRSALKKNYRIYEIMIVQGGHYQSICTAVSCSMHCTDHDQMIHGSDMLCIAFHNSTKRFESPSTAEKCVQQFIRYWTFRKQIKKRKKNESGVSHYEFKHSRLPLIQLHLRKTQLKTRRLSVNNAFWYFLFHRLKHEFLMRSFFRSREC